ncbi:MAG TPA: hypothetical protein H9669_07635 [Firmicutes bacterium]|nr:hypothetical protein [Bacillota bacterium]
MNEGVVTLDTYYNQNADIKAEIRKCMQRNLIDDALSLTEQLDDSDPDFYFFQAWAFAEKGWTQRAREYARIAMQMDNANAEYAALWNRLDNQAGHVYKAQSGRQGYGRDCGCCEMASCLVCSDCCCESMGGDLITCC